MRPGIVLDAEPPLAAALLTNRYMFKNESVKNSIVENGNDNKKPSINCFAAILLGIKCELDGIDDNNTQQKAENSIVPLNPLLSTELDGSDKEDEVEGSGVVGELIESSDNDKIVTVKEGLVPDRDEVFLNKPMFISPSVPVPLEIINDQSNTNVEQGMRGSD